MITGVGFLLFSIIDKIPKLFVVRELKSKPEICKEAGMLSFPLETFNKKDQTTHGTILRLLHEEIGVSKKSIIICKIVPRRFKLIPGRNDVETIYGYGIFLGNPNQNFNPYDDDIIFVGWMTIRELLAQKTRVEVHPIIDDFLTREILGEV